MSLLASTTLGVESASTLRAEVRADVPLEGRYRLVVQTFAGNGAKPVASVQRAVTGQELRDGVQVSLVEMGERSSKSRVVAWVEVGAPDLEFDGRLSRPRAGSIVGTARGEDNVHILLTKRAA